MGQGFLETSRCDEQFTHLILKGKIILMTGEEQGEILKGLFRLTNFFVKKPKV
jgi:hypothetical protein